MKVKAKGLENGDLEVGFLCGDCGFWETIPIAIPFIVRKMYGGKLKEYEEEKEIVGTFICPTCRPDGEITNESYKRESMGSDHRPPERPVNGESQSGDTGKSQEKVTDEANG